jgi:hypothetical protein
VALIDSALRKEAGRDSGDHFEYVMLEKMAPQEQKVVVDRARIAVTRTLQVESARGRRKQT